VRNYAAGACHPPHTVSPSTQFWRFAQKNLFSCAREELPAKASNSGIVVFFDPRKVQALLGLDFGLYFKGSQQVNQ